MNDQTSLLDGTLDDLNDLPEFKLYPPGAHRVTIKWEEKPINDNPAIELKFKAIETMELADPEKDTALAEGDEGNVAFMLNHEFGVGNFKKVLKQLVEAMPQLQGMTNRQVCEATDGAECVIVTKLRKDKNDPDKHYLTLVSIAPV